MVGEEKLIIFVANNKEQYIARAILEHLGPRVVTYHAGLSQKERSQSVAAFQQKSLNGAQISLSTWQMGGLGLNLHSSSPLTLALSLPSSIETLRQGHARNSWLGQTQRTLLMTGHLVPSFDTLFRIRHAENKNEAFLTGTWRNLLGRTKTSEADAQRLLDTLEGGLQTFDAAAVEKEVAIEILMDSVQCEKSLVEASPANDVATLQGNHSCDCKEKIKS